jgi:hypothetical protein
LSQFPKEAVRRDFPDPAVPTTKTTNMFYQFTPRSETISIQSNLDLRVKAFSVGNWSCWRGLLARVR